MKNCSNEYKKNVYSVIQFGQHFHFSRLSIFSKCLDGIEENVFKATDKVTNSQKFKHLYFTWHLLRNENVAITLWRCYLSDARKFDADAILWINPVKPD